ncbi:MAG: hypothetical protein DSO01_04945 [Archaeoglobi archaeon]|nr:MAG: hypothetical protein DSO01_04945 [Archaeoglobi archaeon]TDA29886.1 MAG: hypothetical protein DSO00_03055 [Archaeoglobi archaeon]
MYIASSQPNTWNTTKSEGTNIIGGNYWASCSGLSAQEEELI